jgi:hypothetical protein
MLWMTWRQFPAQTLVAVAALAVTAATLALAGTHLTRLYDTSGIPGCQARGDCGAARQNFLTQVNSSLGNHLPLLFGTALVAVPAIIGIFWARPCSPANWKQAPTGRFWALQWYETAIFACAAVALAAFCIWRTRRL